MPGAVEGIQAILVEGPGGFGSRSFASRWRSLGSCEHLGPRVYG